MEYPVSPEVERAAAAAQKAADAAHAETLRLHPEMAKPRIEKQYPQPAQIPTMPWSVLQRRIATLIASIHLPEDTHPSRVEAVLGVRFSQTNEDDWEAEGTVDAGWAYSISVSKDFGEYSAGHSIYIYLMPPEIDGASVSRAGSTLCTWPMDDFSKIALQNGYEKGMEQQLAKERWEFNDIRHHAAYERYFHVHVYRMKGGTERAIPCLLKIGMSTGRKEAQP